MNPNSLHPAARSTNMLSPRSAISARSPIKAATAITFSTPNSQARSQTINALHNKLEYERQIQDQLLLEQQREIEQLSSQLEHAKLDLSQLNSTLSEKQSELHCVSQQREQLTSECEECHTSMQHLKERLEAVESSHATRIEQLQQNSDSRVDRANALQSKLEQCSATLSHKDGLVAALKAKVAALQQSLSTATQENTELVASNTRLDSEHHKARSSKDAWKRKSAAIHSELKGTKDALCSTKDALRVCSQKLHVATDQASTFDSLLKDKCRELDSAEERLSSAEASHAAELAAVRAEAERVRARSSQEAFELQSRFFSAKEALVELRGVAKELQALKGTHEELRAQSTAAEFEANTRIGRIRRLSEEQRNQEAVVRRMTAESAQLSDSVAHYKRKAEQLSKERAYFKEQGEGVQRLEQRVRELKSKGERRSEAMRRLLSQTPRVSCSAHRFCENPLCSQAQFAWLPIAVDELAALRKAEHVRDAGSARYELVSSVRGCADVMRMGREARSQGCGQDAFRMGTMGNMNMGHGKCETPHTIDINIHNAQPPKPTVNTNESERNYCHCSNARKDRLQMLRNLVQDRRTLRQPYY